MRTILGCLTNPEDRQAFLEASVDLRLTAELSSSFFDTCRRLLERSYDLVVLDADGCSAEPEHMLRTFDARTVKPPFIVLSTEAKRRKRALHCGAAGVVEPPLTRKCIVDAIRRSVSEEAFGS